MGGGLAYGLRWGMSDSDRAEHGLVCDKRFAVKNSDILGLALIFNLSNLRMTILHAKNRFKVARYDES